MESAAVAAGREHFMSVAIAMARRGLAAGGPPIGACIVRNNEIVARAHNDIIARIDATAHAEMEAIRLACSSLRRLRLDDCAIYVTVEPCLMCLSACHYAGLQQIYYGAGIADLGSDPGAELVVDTVVRQQLGLKLAITGGVAAAECRTLLQEWQAARRTQR